MGIRRLFLVILVYMRQLDYSCCGLGPSLLPLTSVEPLHTWHFGPLGPAHAPAQSPDFPGDALDAADASKGDHQRMPPARSSSFHHKYGYDCTGFICSDPLTLAPLGSPCACVLPMKVEIELGADPFWVFTLVSELAVEIAAGTYVKQSQVRIVAAVSSRQDQGRTRVLIHLIPLGEKFDKMTAFLLYERFWRKEIPINATVFGGYKVLSINYPGLPTSLPSSPREPGGHELPFAARLPTKKAHKMNPRIIAAVISSLLACAVFCAILAYIVFKTRKLRRLSTAVGPTFASFINKRSGRRFIISSSMASSTSPSLVSTMPTFPSSLRTFMLAQLELATNKFNSHKVLGEGGFGCVYHGIIEDGIEVAVKLLKRQDEDGDREFIAEIQMLSHLHHRNLVKLLGICIEGCTRCLVYELVRNGSVESHLHGVDKEREPLDWDTRIKIALGSARALAYLHEDSNPRVIHRDFKASNILLDDDYTPRVSDFGLALVAAEGSHHISTHVMGTFGYVAPEYAMTGHLLVKSDVYSYGVVLLELLSGRKPIDMSQPSGQENLVTWARPLFTSREGLELLVDPSLDGKYDFDSLAKVAAIASMCVQPEVSNRPFMGEVIQALKLIYSDRDEECEDLYSNKELHYPAYDNCRDEAGKKGNWWDWPTSHPTAGGCASSYMTVEYGSSPLDEMVQAQLSPSLAARMKSIVMLNRSGPLRTKRHRRAFGRLRGSVSEHGFLSRHFAADGCWF